MLGKKTWVLFTISSVNFELKQGNNIDPCSWSEFPAGVWASLSLSLSLSLCVCLSLSLSSWAI